MPLNTASLLSGIRCAAGFHKFTAQKFQVRVSTRPKQFNCPSVPCISDLQSSRVQVIGTGPTLDSALSAATRRKTTRRGRFSDPGAVQFTRVSTFCGFQGLGGVDSRLWLWHAGFRFFWNSLCKDVLKARTAQLWYLAHCAHCHHRSLPTK